jgi:hypothetical protein
MLCQREKTGEKIKEKEASPFAGRHGGIQKHARDRQL